MPDHLITAARERHALALARAEAALHALSSAGEPITFAAVARQGKVSTDFLYNQPALRRKISELRQQPAHLRRPAERSASTEPESNSAAMRALSSQIKELKRRHAEEIAELRKALGVAQGENLLLRRRLAAAEPPPTT